MSLMGVNAFFSLLPYFFYLLNYFAMDLNILFVSALVNVVASLKTSSLRDFFVRIWLLYALFLFTLPLPVNFILLHAPLWDFILFLP